MDGSSGWGKHRSHILIMTIQYMANEWIMHWKISVLKALAHPKCPQQSMSPSRYLILKHFDFSLKGDIMQRFNVHFIH